MKIVLLIVCRLYYFRFKHLVYPRYQQDIRLNNLLIFNEETFIYISRYESACTPT